MGQRTQLNWGVSRVEASALDLLEDEERRCLDLSITQISIMRQMVFPWAFRSDRLVESHTDYQTTVDMPVAYLEALEELEILLSGAYDGPKGGCPVSEIFVDRGDLPGGDFSLATLTADAAWHEMDLTNVIGDTSATRVLIRSSIWGPAGEYIYYREDGNSNAINVGGQRTLAASAYTPNEAENQITMSGAQKIEYLLSAGTLGVDVVIRGYWVPA